MELNFKIQGDKLIAGSLLSGNTGNVGTYICNFDITDNKDFAWFCVFKANNKAYQQVIESGKCVIPNEVLQKTGKIEIGCYGTNGEDRISTNWLGFSVEEGAYSNATSPQAPQPDVWETLVMNSVPYIGESGNWYIYDIEKKTYVDTGMPSRGEEGDGGENAIKEKVAGKAIVFKDISPATKKLTIKLNGTQNAEESVLYVTGQNIWDEKMEYDSNNLILYNTNAIPVAPDTDYYLCCMSPLFVWEEHTGIFTEIVYYDNSGQQISAIYNVARNSIITTPPDCCYINFKLYELYGNTYKNDICINVSDKKINGTYEAYQQVYTYAVNPQEDIVIDKPAFPVVTVFTDCKDITLECEYNKDLNAVIGGVEFLLGGI